MRAHELVERDNRIVREYERRANRREQRRKQIENMEDEEAAIESQLRNTTPPPEEIYICNNCKAILVRGEEGNLFATRNINPLDAIPLNDGCPLCFVDERPQGYRDMDGSCFD
jgi:hypothetical protein